MSGYNKEQLEQMILKHVSQSSGKRFMSTVYQDLECMDQVIAYLTEPFRGKVDAVASPGVAGYVLGGMIARELKVPFIPIMRADSGEERPEEFNKASYVDHADQVRPMKIRKDAAAKGEKILLVDNWIETAATITICQTLLEEAETTLAGIAAFGRDVNRATDKLMEAGNVRVAAEIR